MPALSLGGFLQSVMLGFGAALGWAAMNAVIGALKRN